MQPIPTHVFELLKPPLPNGPLPESRDLGWTGLWDVPMQPIVVGPPGQQQIMQAAQQFMLNGLPYNVVGYRWACQLVMPQPGEQQVSAPGAVLEIFVMRPQAAGRGLLLAGAGAMDALAAAGLGPPKAKES